MGAAAALTKAQGALTGATDSGLQALLRRARTFTGKLPTSVLSDAPPEVVLMAWLLAAAEAGGAATRARNLSTQWNLQTYRATPWAATVAGFLAPSAGDAAAAATGSQVAYYAAPGAVSKLVTVMATYFDSVTGVSPALGKASYGAAHMAGWCKLFHDGTPLGDAIKAAKDAKDSTRLRTITDPAAPWYPTLASKHGFQMHSSSYGDFDAGVAAQMKLLFDEWYSQLVANKAAATG